MWSKGVPLETLDLSTCLAASRAVELLSEIVVEVLGPDGALEKEVQMVSRWDSNAHGLFVEQDQDDSSGVEDHNEDDPDSGSDEEV